MSSLCPAGRLSTCMQAALETEHPNGTYSQIMTYGNI